MIWPLGSMYPPNGKNSPPCSFNSIFATGTREFISSSHSSFAFIPPPCIFHALRSLFARLRQLGVSSFAQANFAEPHTVEVARGFDDSLCSQMLDPSRVKHVRQPWKLTAQLDHGVQNYTRHFMKLVRGVREQALVNAPQVGAVSWRARVLPAPA